MAQPMKTLPVTSFSFKVVVLGVERSSIALKFINKDQHTIGTLCGSFLNKKLKIESRDVNLQIWDMPSQQERFCWFSPICFRGSDGAVLIYDPAVLKSFVEVKFWVQELRDLLGESILICIVGYKKDKEKDRVISTEDIDSYTASVDASHFCIDQDQDIDAPFVDLAKRMLLAAEKKRQQ